MKKNLVILVLLIMSSFITKAQIYKDSTITDPRDNQTYKVRKIDNQWWFLENLKYLPEGADKDLSFRFKNVKNNYKNLASGYQETEHLSVFGRYYSYTLAMESCPKGWHLPSDIEWQKLESFLGLNAFNLNIDFSDPITNKKFPNGVPRGDSILFGNKINRALEFGKNPFLKEFLSLDSLEQAFNKSKKNSKKPIDYEGFYRKTLKSADYIITDEKERKEDFEYAVNLLENLRKNDNNFKLGNLFFGGFGNGEWTSKDVNVFWSSTSFSNTYVFSRFYWRDMKGFGRESSLKKVNEYNLCRCVDNNSLKALNSAIKDYSIILVKDTNNKTALVKRGLEYMKIDQIAMAREDFVKAYRLNKKDYDIEIERICMTMLIEIHKQLYAYYKIDLVLDTVNAKENQRIIKPYISKGIIYDLKFALKNHPDDDYLNYQAAFYLTYKDDDYSYARGSSVELEEAFGYINKALKIDAKNIVYHELLIAILNSQKKYKQAEAACNKAILIDPQYGNFYVYMAVAMMHNRDLSNTKAKLKITPWCTPLGGCYALTQSDLKEICKNAIKGKQFGTTLMPMELDALCADLKASELQQMHGNKKYIGPKGGVFEISPSGAKKYFPELRIK